MSALKYAVIDSNNGYTIGENLTAVEAMNEILQHDSAEWETRKDGNGWRIFIRKQVANKPWSQTLFYSAADKKEDAENELTLEVFDAAKVYTCEYGYQAMTQEDYNRMQEELAEEGAA